MRKFMREFAEKIAEREETIMYVADIPRDRRSPAADCKEARKTIALRRRATFRLIVGGKNDFRM